MNHIRRLDSFVEIVTSKEFTILEELSVLLTKQRIENAPHAVARCIMDGDAILRAACLQLLQSSGEVVDAIKALGQAIIAQQASGLQLVLVVVKHNRMNIEGHSVLLATHLAGFKICISIVRGLQAHAGQICRCDFAQGTRRHTQWQAREMISHHIWAFTNSSRGLNFGVERHTPFQGGGLNFNLVGILFVEISYQLLHTHAVTATKKIPPHNSFFSKSTGRNQCSGQHCSSH